jgi:hypothetical protein
MRKHTQEYSKKFVSWADFPGSLKTKKTAAGTRTGSAHYGDTPEDRSEEDTFAGQ